MLTLITVACIFAGQISSIVKEGEVFLETAEAFNGVEVIAVNENSNIFVLSFNEGKIFMFDKQGKFVKLVANRGNGPGEVQEPYLAYPANGNKELFVFEGGGKFHRFNFSTGKFLESRLDIPGAYKWACNDNRIVALRIGNFDKVLFEENDFDFSITAKWGKRDKEAQLKFYSRRHAFAVDNSGTAYHQEGFEPIVYVYKKGKSTPKEWMLKIPKYYREFTKPYDLKKNGFSRKKMANYLESFTHLNKLEILGDRYLLVQWRTSDPYPSSLDVYDLKTRKLLVSNFPLESLEFTVANGMIFSLVPPSDTELDAKNKIVTYRLVESE